MLVRPTSAVRKFAVSRDPIAAGRELAVRSVLEGTIQRADETIRVTVQLIDVDRDAPLWSDRFDVHVSDVFSLQDRISDQVARALMINLGGHARRCRPDLMLGFEIDALCLQRAVIDPRVDIELS